ncbi:MAG: hypothetical protein LBK95_05565 [Bifidobacteriaceae bacterium]|jgi:hypothetical protein|nr:hypothetical protein [Bifidobacteriaceae bacterium]
MQGMYGWRIWPLRTIGALALAVAGVNAALVASGVIDLARAGRVVVLAEASALDATWVTTAILVAWGSRRAGGIVPALRELVRVVVPIGVRRAARAELGTFANLARWARGRRNGRAPDASIHAYTKGMFMLPVVFAALSAVEVVVIELIVPWQWLRLTLLALTVYGVALLLGMLAGRVVNPHLVTDREVVLKLGSHEVARIDRADIAAVTANRRFSPVNPEIRDGQAVLATFEGTNVELRLRRPVNACLPTWLGRATEPGPVTVVRLNLDDPCEFVGALSRAESPRKTLVRRFGPFVPR